MGCRSSKGAPVISNRQQQITVEKTQNKIKEALKVKLEVDGDSHKLLTLERILLKFEKMHTYKKKEE